MTQSNIKVGDKVRYTGESKSDLTHGKVYEVVWVGDYYFDVLDDVGDQNCIVSESCEPITDDTPTLWRDMTDAEKGALLLAHHEGRVIEGWLYGEKWKVLSPEWDWHNAYRIKPEPKTPREWWIVGGSEAWDNEQDAIENSQLVRGDIIHVREVLDD